MKTPKWLLLLLSIVLICFWYHFRPRVESATCLLSTMVRSTETSECHHLVRSRDKDACHHRVRSTDTSTCHSVFSTSTSACQMSTDTSSWFHREFSQVTLCSPNEDFGRSNEHLDEFLRSTFQGCEYRIWATKRWKVLRKECSRVSFSIPKSSFGSHKVANKNCTISLHDFTNKLAYVSTQSGHFDISFQSFRILLQFCPMEYSRMKGPS